MSNKYQNQKIALLGLGVENQALLAFLLKTPKISVTICDRRLPKELGERYQSLVNNPRITWRLGKNFNQRLFEFNLLFRSPGWPLFCPEIQEAIKKGSEITSAMNLFLALCPSHNIIGVTGTKGKGTTASLIYHIIKQSRKKVFLGGNIGVAPFSFINKIKKSDWIVLELSSFQLEGLNYSPLLAVITNIYKEHLAPADPLNPNYHRSYRDYILAKLRIAQNRTQLDKLFFNIHDQKIIEKYLPRSNQKDMVPFSASSLPSQLMGKYNQENVGAAVAVAKYVKIKKEVIARAVKTFKGLGHRLELVGNINGIRYYDNSFATNPESTIMDLDSFQEPIVLLAGGADKGANFRPLAKKIKQRVKAVVLLAGEATPRIKKELLAAKYPLKKISLAQSMAEAIRLARKSASSGDIILLSTACASFGLFKNYKERGNLFKLYAQKK